MGGCCTITEPIIINKTGIDFIVVSYIMIKVKILTVFILRNIQRIIDLDRKGDMFFFILLNFFSHIHLFFIILLLPIYMTGWIIIPIWLFDLTMHIRFHLA